MINLTNNNYNMPASSIVAQFTVYTNPSNLSNLLQYLEINNLNISAFTIQEKDNKSVFKFIVGEKHNQTSNDINITRSILKQYKYYFDESKVVRLSTNDSKLKLTSQYNELIKSLSIYNSYIGESNSIIYETCCPTKTLKVLSQLS